MDAGAAHNGVCSGRSADGKAAVRRRRPEEAWTAVRLIAVSVNVSG